MTTPVSRAVAIATTTKDTKILSLSFSSSRLPKRMEKYTPLPMHSPSRMEVRKVISE